MFFALKLAGTILAAYAGVMGARVAMEWLKEVFEKIRPNRYK